jgi:hypothetical protein
MRVDGVADLAMEVERGPGLRTVEVRDVRLVDADKVAVTAVVRRVRREELMDSREGPCDLGRVEELDLLAVDERVERFPYILSRRARVPGHSRRLREADLDKLPLTCFEGS